MNRREQTTQWSKEIGQKDKQRSTKDTHKTNDRVKGTQLNPEGDRRCSGRVISSCSTSGIRQIILLVDDVYMTVRCKTTIQAIFFNNWFYVRCTYERGTISKLKTNIVIWLENNNKKTNNTKQFLNEIKKWSGLKQGRTTHPCKALFCLSYVQ